MGIETRGKAVLELRPNHVQQGSLVLVAGAKWPIDAIVLRIGKEINQPVRVLRGTVWNGHFVPDVRGEFLVEIATGSLKPGTYSVRAETLERGEGAEARLVVDKRVRDPKAPRPSLDKPFIRGEFFKSQRTGNRPGWPNGMIGAAENDWKRVHGGIHPPPFIAPIHGLANWVPLGPAPFTEGKGRHADNSGRIRSFAIDPVTPARMYVGTSSGGVWRSIDGGATWSPRTDDKFSLAIGALAVDPTTPTTVYAGTGEYAPLTDYGGYYGNGLLKSINAGDTWTEIASATFALADIARIVVNPSDGSNLFVAASNGLWESTSSGSMWTQLSSNPCTDVVLVQNPAEAGTRRLLAGFVGLSVRTSANSGSGWSMFTSATVPGAPADSIYTTFGVCRTQKNVIYAAFSQGVVGSDNLIAIAKSIDWGGSWTAQSIPTSGAIYQAKYNLAIQPDPTTPETVVLGVADIFKSTNSGGDWTQVNFTGGATVHRDVHAIVFHPSAPNTLFVGCDGGLFHSVDSCASWETLNGDLASLQLFEIGQHPQYDAIMIAGGIDNGGFHYSGAPIWRRTWVRSEIPRTIMDGDVVIARIDPFNPYVHYYGTGAEGLTHRSDDAGKTFPTVYWVNFPGGEWLPAFEPDPHTAGVLYQGGRKLMRSDDRGTSWHEITADLAGAIRSIGFHPSDPTLVFAGTGNAHVYRITGPSTGTWSPTTVTTDEITYSGLPTAIGFSSIAADAAGQVWVTSSDILAPQPSGEFSNDHVWRLDPGVMTWVSKSDGLVMANPINTIVADPADTTRLYCGGDRSVFSWDAATQHWSVIDEGLPNAPVTRLRIHNPSRKLRAATYGRGIWERSLDGIFSDHFLYMRNNLVDSGSTPSPDFVPHPYVEGDFCYHWQSPDIIVDSTNQTPSVVTSAVRLYDEVEHDGARRGANRVYVTVHNKGPFGVTEARVRAFFAGVSAHLPPFPAGLLADPFSWIPGGSSPWNPVGDAFSVGEIPPGTTRLAFWDAFMIPMSAERHSCLLAFVTSAEDSFNSAGITDPDQLVLQNRMVALKNLDLNAMPSSGGTGPGGSQTPEGTTQPHEISLHGHDPKGGWYSLAIVAGNLPRGAILIAAFDGRTRKGARILEAKVSPRGKKVGKVMAGFASHPKEVRAYDLDNLVIHELRPRTILPIADLFIANNAPARLVVWLHAPEWDPKELYGLDVVQMRGPKVIGGVTINIAEKLRSAG